MISQNYNKQAAEDITPEDVRKTAFEAAYLKALRHIIHSEEEKANSAINALKSIMKQNGAPSEGSEAARQAYQDLAGRNGHKGLLDSLYGDYGYKFLSPWINAPATLAMIKRDVKIFGDVEDQKQLATFEEKTRKFFNLPIDPCPFKLVLNG